MRDFSYYMVEIFSTPRIIELLVLFALHYYLSSRKQRRLGIIVPSVFLLIYTIPGLFLYSERIHHHDIFSPFGEQVPMGKAIIEFVLPYQLIALFYVLVWFLCRVFYQRKNERLRDFWKDPILLIIPILMVIQIIPTVYTVNRHNREMSEINPSPLTAFSAKDDSEYLIENYSESLEKIFHYAEAENENPFITRPKELESDIEKLEETLNGYDTTIYHTKDEKKLYILIYTRNEDENNFLSSLYVGMVWYPEEEILSYFGTEFELDYNDLEKY